MEDKKQPQNGWSYVQQQMRAISQRMHEKAYIRAVQDQKAFLEKTGALSKHDLIQNKRTEKSTETKQNNRLLLERAARREARCLLKKNKNLKKSALAEKIHKNTEIVRLNDSNSILYKEKPSVRSLTRYIEPLFDELE